MCSDCAAMQFVRKERYRGRRVLSRGKEQRRIKGGLPSQKNGRKFQWNNHCSNGTIIVYICCFACCFIANYSIARLSLRWCDFCWLMHLRRGERWEKRRATLLAGTNVNLGWNSYYIDVCIVSLWIILSICITRFIIIIIIFLNRFKHVHLIGQLNHRERTKSKHRYIVRQRV